MTRFQEGDMENGVDSRRKRELPLIGNSSNMVKDIKRPEIAFSQLLEMAVMDRELSVGL